MFSNIGVLENLCKKGDENVCLTRFDSSKYLSNSVELTNAWLETVRNTIINSLWYDTRIREKKFKLYDLTNVTIENALGVTLLNETMTTNQLFDWFRSFCHLPTQIRVSISSQRDLTVNRVWIFL